MMRALSTAFYMLLSILGLSVISLGGLIAVQYFRGKVSGSDLHSILRVIGGTHRVIIPGAAYERYIEFAKDENAARVELESNRGLPETRVPAAMRAREAEASLQTTIDVLNRQLADEKRLVEQVRAEVEAQKVQLADARRALDDERRKNAVVDRDSATQKMRSTLSQMDAEDLAGYLTQVVRDPSQGGPAEAARMLREHLQSDFGAEVLTEMPAPERQRVIPLIENRFAGVPPAAVVKIFQDQDVSPGEQLVYLLQMNPPQALGVYLRLPAEVQERIGPQILRNG